MRPRTFLLAGLVLVALGVSVVVAIPTPTPLARSCDPEASPLVVRFGEPEVRDGATFIPLSLENTGPANVRVLLDMYQVDAYRVQWNGRLSSLPTMTVNVDHIAGHEGEDIAPGAMLAFGDAQLGSDVHGRFRLVAFAAGGCGDTTIELPQPQKK